MIHKHQLHSVSVGLSDITLPSELHPVASDHRQGRRRGTDFIPQTDLLHCTGKGVPSTNQVRLTSFVQLTQ